MDPVLLRRENRFRLYRTHNEDVVLVGTFLRLPRNTYAVCENMLARSSVSGSMSKLSHGHGRVGGKAPILITTSCE